LLFHRFIKSASTNLYLGSRPQPDLDPINLDLGIVLPELKTRSLFNGDQRKKTNKGNFLIEKMAISLKERSQRKINRL
jgi:hypothetical protein